MDQGRVKYFKSLSEEEINALSHEDFTVSEIQEILNDTALSKIDRKIAHDRFIDCMTLEEISAKENYDIKTVMSHMDKICKKFVKTCKKYFHKSN